MVERRLQISLVSAATLAACMLGVAQNNMIVVLIGVFTGVTSLMFTDILKWMVLDRRVSYMAMVAAAVFSLNGFWRNTSEDQLLAIANMLIFVQIGLMYQEKTLRVYSHLAVFSVLQVVVAALLNVGGAFGLMLSAYVATGSFAVMMFSMHRESLRMEQLQNRALDEEAEKTQQSLPQNAEWVMAYGGGIRCQAAVSQREASAKILQPNQLRQFLSMGLAALAFAVFFFFFSPRLGNRGWTPGGGRTGKVGFTTEVSFRQLNRLVESNEVVMRVSFQNLRTGEPYRLFSEPYFRGAALAEYTFDAENPAWKPLERISPFWKRLPQARGFSESTDLVRQEISCRPTREDVLFGVAPFYGDNVSPSWVNVDNTSNVMKINPADSMGDAQVLRYSLITTGFQSGAQSQITRQFYPRSSGAAQRMRDKIERNFKEFEKEKCPSIQAVSDQLVLAEGEAAQKSRIYTCQVLMRYLLGDRFTYSLDTSQIRSLSDPKLDPVEDFFANHRTGFCGHFASALALMLRSQGIPARVVVGYKGGEYNEVGGYYLVRSRDAHAWVEAYLRPQDLVDISDGRERDLISAAGGWLRLDPTPGGLGSEFDKGAMAYVDQVLDYSRTLWSDYVLGITQNPRDGSNAALGLSQNRRRQSQPTLKDRLQKFLPAWVWNALGAAPIIALVLAACWVVINNLPRMRWRRAAKRRQAKRRRSPIDFYNDLENLVAKKRNLRRRTDQTPREFAVAIREQLEESEHRDQDALRALQRIIDAFYEARFGGRPLDSDETQAIEQALRRLDSALSPQAT